MLKRIILAILFGVFYHFGEAQEISKKKEFQVKTNTLALPFQAWNINIEKRLNDRISLQFSPTVINDTYLLDIVKAKGYLFVTDLKVYDKRKGKSNRYWSVFLKYQSFEFEDSDAKIKETGPGIGVIIGKLIKFHKIPWLIVDLYGGINYVANHSELINAIDSNNYQVPVPVTLDGLGYRAGVSIGVQF